MRSTIALVLALLAAATPAAAAEATPGEGEADADHHAKPYLSAETSPDELAALPAPPAEGTAAKKADLDLYWATRSLAGSTRWAIAARDADRSPAAVWQDFACALGAEVPAERLPRVIDLIDRLNADVEQATRAVKDTYKRPRPLVGNDAPICVKRSDRFVASYSYPSGHATQGWATAIVLAELAPDRAGPLMRRGFTFGESRIVCGAHWGSDVDEGRIAATTLVAVLNADPDFRADVGDARRQLSALRGDNRRPRTRPPAGSRPRPRTDRCVDGPPRLAVASGP